MQESKKIARKIAKKTETVVWRWRRWPAWTRRLECQAQHRLPRPPSDLRPYKYIVGVSGQIQTVIENYSYSELNIQESATYIKPTCGPSLLYRRPRGDVIETYKYLHGIYNTNCLIHCFCHYLLEILVSVRVVTVCIYVTVKLWRFQILKISLPACRPILDFTIWWWYCFCLKLQKRDCESVLRANVLGYRIVNLWNSLPEDIVSAPTVNSLKGRFDRHCLHLRYSHNCEDFKF